MSQLIDQLRATDYPEKSARDLTLSYGEYLEQNKRDDIFAANPDFAQEYANIKDEIARDTRPGYGKEFSNAFGSAVDDLQASGYALGALAAHGADKIGIPGATPVRNWMLEMMKSNQDEAEAARPSVGSYRDISGEHPIEDTARYVTYGLGTVAPSMAQAALSSLAGAAIGGAVGSAVEPGGGTVVGGIGGALFGLAEKKLAQKAVSKLLEQGIKDVTLEMAAKTIPRQLVAAEAKNLAIQYGGNLALAASSVGSEIGSIYADSPDAPGTAIAFGIPAGLLDAIPEGYVLSRFFKPGKAVTEAAAEKATGYFRRFATEAFKTVPMEGSTEAAQTLLEIAAKKYAAGESPTTFTDEDYKQALNAGIIGALGGLAMAPVAAAGEHRAPVDRGEAYGTDLAARLKAFDNPSAEDARYAPFQPSEDLKGAGPMQFAGEIPEADLTSPRAMGPSSQVALEDAAPTQAETFTTKEANPYELGAAPQTVELPKAVSSAVDAADEAARAWETRHSSQAETGFGIDTAPVPSTPLEFGDTPVLPQDREQLGAPPSAQITDGPLANLVGTNVQYQGYTGQLVRDNTGSFMVMPTVREGTQPFWVEVEGSGKDPSTLASAVGIVPTEPANPNPKAPGAVTVPQAPGRPASERSKVPLGDLFPSDLVPNQNLRGDVQGVSGVLAAPSVNLQPPAPNAISIQSPAALSVRDQPQGGEAILSQDQIVQAPSGAGGQAQASTGSAPIITEVPPAPFVPTAPTGEQVAQKSGNGVDPIPDTAVPNLRRLRIFEQPKPAPITEDEHGPMPANARPAATVESQALSENPLVALDKAVGKPGKGESNVAAIIVDNATGQAYMRTAYRGADNTLYLDLASTRKGTATGQGSTVSAEADLLRGSEGRPARKLFAERLTGGDPRYTVYGVAELTSPKGPRNWNVGTVENLETHPGVNDAAKRYWSDEARSRPTVRAKMPVAATKDIETFYREMAAWRTDNRTSTDEKEMQRRVDEFVAAQNKAYGGRMQPRQMAAFAAEIISSVNEIAAVQIKQTTRISADYITNTASTNYLFQSTLRALAEGRQVDVAAFEQTLMGALDKTSQTTGIVVDQAGKRKIVAFAMASITGPVDAGTIVSLLHETGHVVTDGLAEPLRVAFQEAIEHLPYQQQRWLMNPLSLDVRLLANADPETLAPRQRAALAQLSAEEIAAARRIDPTALAEERMAEHLAQLGYDKSEAKGLVQKFVRFVKDLWFQMSMAVQAALKGPDDLNPDLVRKYVENRFLQFVHRDSAYARDRITDLQTWIGAPATDSQKIPVFPSGNDWDQRLQFVDVASDQLIPVQTANYRPDAQTRELKLALDRAAQWIAENPAGKTPDTPALRFTQRAHFSAPFSNTPSVTLNTQFAQINLEDTIYRNIAADETIGPLLPLQDGEKITPTRFATQWLRLPSEQTPEMRMKSALESAKQPDPLTGKPIENQPDITVDKLPSAEQRIVDKEGKPKVVQITEAQDNAIDMSIQSLRDTARRLAARVSADNERYETLTRIKERAAKTTGEFASADQYELSRLGEELLLRQRIALRLDGEIKGLLAKFRPGDIVSVFPGAELFSIPDENASEEKIRANHKYRVPLDLTFSTTEARSAMASEIARGEAWLKNEDNRNQGQIYGVVSEQVRKLRQIPFNQERAAVSAVLRRLSGGLIDTLNASGLPSVRLMAKKLAGATSFVEAYRADLTTLGRKWETAFAAFAKAMGRPNDQAFVEEMWDPLSRTWNFIDSSERANLGTPSESNIFANIERSLKNSGGMEIKTEAQREALRALTMQSIERERYFGQMFDQHPELQVKDKALGVYRRLRTHGIVTGSRGLSRDMLSLALRMNPAWSDTKMIGPDDQRTFWQAAPDIYEKDRQAFDKRTADLFDGYVVDDFVAPLATNNVALFQVMGSDGQPRTASLLNVRSAWREADGDVTKFAEALHRNEGGDEKLTAQTVGLIMGTLRGQFGKLKSILDKQASAKNSGIETLQRQMLDGREAEDLPAQWVSYATMDTLSNHTLLNQLAMQSAFGPGGLDAATSSALGDKVSADGHDPLVAGGEFAETIHAAKRELTEIRGRFEVLRRDGVKDAEIRRRMGDDDYEIARHAPQSIASLDHADTMFRTLHTSSGYLSTELKAANNLVGMTSTLMLQNPRSGLQQIGDILGLIVDLKLSTQTLKGLRGAIKTLAQEIGNGVFEAFGQQAAFGVAAAQRRQLAGSKDSETRTAWREKINGQGPRNQLATPTEYESRTAAVARNVTRATRKVRELVPTIGSPLAKPGEDRLGPQFSAGVFHTITRAALTASQDAGYDLFADIASRGVDYIQGIPLSQREAYVRELEMGIRDLSADELGYYKSFLLNDEAAFHSLKTALETGMAGERSVGDFVAKGYRRMQAAQAEHAAGRGDGAWDVISSSQFTDIINYVNSQWTIQPNFATVPSFMHGPLKPLFIFLTWPYLAMRRAARGFTDANQRMTWAGANSSVADGAKAFFIVAAPAAIAGSFAIDWYDKYLLDKRQNLREANLSTAIPVVGPVLNPRAFVERWAKYGTSGFPSEILNMAVNYDSQKGLSLDNRVVAFNAIQSLFAGAIKTPISQEFNATYASVGRPILQAVGAGGILQYLQIANNLLGLNNQEAAINSRINTGNYLRAAGKELNLPVRVFQGQAFEPTPVSPYLQQMELAALINNPELFRESYRKAVETARTDGPPSAQGSVDAARKYVAENFADRHPLKRLFKSAPTETDYRKMLGIMDEHGAQEVRKSISSFNRYLTQFFGKKPYYGKADTGALTVEQLIRNANRINSGIETQANSLNTIP